MEFRTVLARRELTLGVLMVAGVLSGCNGSSADSSASDASASGAMVALSSASYTVAPNASAVVTIERGNSSTGSATVGYTTVDGTATAGADYVTTSGTVIWNDGEHDPKTVTVPLTCDASNKHFAFTLTSVKGTADFGSPVAATIDVSARCTASTGSSSSSSSGAISSSSSGATGSSSSGATGSSSSGATSSSSSGAASSSSSGATSSSSGSSSSSSSSSSSGGPSALQNTDTWQNSIANPGVRQAATLIPVCTTALSGSHHTYNIGKAGSADTFATVPWAALVAGDVVNIYPGTYKWKIGLRAQGTATNPVIINGVTDSGCNKPILDFSGSTTAPGSTNIYALNTSEKLGGIVVIRAGSGDTLMPPDAYGVYEPQYIIVQGLQLQNATDGATYTSNSGGTGTFQDAGCIWSQSGEHLVYRNNVMTGCGFGFFAMAKDGLLSETNQFVVLANNWIALNGASGQELDHNVYMQANAPVVEGNFFGQLVAGGLGSSYKDRSAQSVIRYNTVSCALQCFDLVESDDQAGDGIVTLPWYGTDYVYDNTIVSTGTPAIHYGGDNFGEQNSGGFTTTLFVPPANQPYRSHLLFWGNTYTLTTSAYNDAVMKVSYSGASVDAWGDTFSLVGFTGGGAESWLWWAGTLRLGPGNVVTGTAPIPAWSNGPSATATPGFYSVTSGNPIPSDPNLALLH